MPTTPIIETLSHALDSWQFLYILAITVALLSTFAIVVFAFHIQEHRIGLRISNYVYVVASVLAVVSTIVIVVKTKSLDAEKDRIAGIEIQKTKASASQAEATADEASRKAQEARGKAEDARQKAESIRAKAEEARQNSLKAEKDAQAAVIDKEKILRDNLQLQKQVEDERMARVQIEQKIAPRELTKAAQERLIAELRPLKLQEIDFVTFTGNAEADHVASQLQYAFVTVGAKVHTFSPMGGSVQGIIIEYDMDDASATKGARNLADALIASGMQQILSPNLPPMSTQLGAYSSDGSPGTAKIRIFVGSK